MSINLAKNQDTLVAAWKSVVDDKSPINWAVFGYEGQTNNLKVCETGQGGLEELVQELDSGHVMYAFCRVIDNKTSLPKCLLINWQGEGAPIVRKGTCANHIRDIEKLLKGAHITINARCEDDVEVDLIMQKLGRATGSAYKFNEPRCGDVGNTVPIGTTYKKVNAEKEINAIERDQFWRREEIEEKERLQLERTKWETEKERLEREIKSREEKETQLREQQASAKDVALERHREAEKRSEQMQNQRNNQDKNHQPESNNDVDQRSRSEELRKQRNQEAQQLISQRTIDARAIFERNTVAGQMHNSKPPSRSGSIESAAKALEQIALVQEEVKQEEEEEPITREIPYEEPRIVVVENHHQIPEPEQIIEQEVMTIKQQPEPEPTVIIEPTKIENEENNEVATNQVEDGGPYVYFDPNNEGMKARALYDYQAADDTEITFDPGDVITHIDTIDEGWWQGLGPDGTYGLFPANYVEVISNPLET